MQEEGQREGGGGGDGKAKDGFCREQTRVEITDLSFLFILDLYRLSSLRSCSSGCCAGFVDLLLRFELDVELLLPPLASLPPSLPSSRPKLISLPPYEHTSPAFQLHSSRLFKPNVLSILLTDFRPPIPPFPLPFPLSGRLEMESSRRERFRLESNRLRPREEDGRPMEP